MRRQAIEQIFRVAQKILGALPLRFAYDRVEEIADEVTVLHPSQRRFGVAAAMVIVAGMAGAGAFVPAA